MSTSPEPTIRLSVLDRLLDDGGDIESSTWLGSVEALKASLVRDLEWLLNSRRIVEPVGPEYPEIRNSVYHYGIPDISSRSADSVEEQQVLSRDIEECLRLFEPRLTDVRVVVRPSNEKGARLARFVIEGMLKMEPNPERVVFDTVLETPTGKFSVSGDADA